MRDGGYGGGNECLRAFDCGSGDWWVWWWGVSVGVSVKVGVNAGCEFMGGGKYE